MLEGTIGSDAGAMGGALLPLYANFAPDCELFLKLAVCATRRPLKGVKIS